MYVRAAGYLALLAPRGMSDPRVEEVFAALRRAADWAMYSEHARMFGVGLLLGALVLGALALYPGEPNDGFDASGLGDFGTEVENDLRVRSAAKRRRQRKRLQLERKEGSARQKHAERVTKELYKVASSQPGAVAGTGDGDGGQQGLRRRRREGGDVASQGSGGAGSASDSGSDGENDAFEGHDDAVDGAEEPDPFHLSDAQRSRMKKVLRVTDEQIDEAVAKARRGETPSDGRSALRLFDAAVYASLLAALAYFAYRDYNFNVFHQLRKLFPRESRVFANAWAQ